MPNVRVPRYDSTYTGCSTIRMFDNKFINLGSEVLLQKSLETRYLLVNTFQELHLKFSRRISADLFPSNKQSDVIEYTARRPFIRLFLDHRHFGHENDAFRVMNLPLKLMVGDSVVLIVFHINIHPATRARETRLLIDLAYLAIPLSDPSIDECPLY